MSTVAETPAGEEKPAAKPEGEAKPATETKVPAKKDTGPSDTVILAIVVGIALLLAGLMLDDKHAHCEGCRSNPFFHFDEQRGEG